MGMFSLKDLTILNLHSLLLELVLELYDAFNLDIITSAYRPGDKGVHGTQPLRGIDFRCRDAVVGKRIEGWINQRWKYDSLRPEKKCAVWHNVHLHLQVHNNTRKK
jgi:hypothetical protein